MEEYKYNKYKLLSREAFIELKETEEEKQRLKETWVVLKVRLIQNHQTSLGLDKRYFLAHA